MQFVELVTNTETMTGLIRRIPETWWSSSPCRLLCLCIFGRLPIK